MDTSVSDLWKKAQDAFINTRAAYLDEISARLAAYRPPLPDWLLEHVNHMLATTTAGGKLYRGITVVMSALSANPAADAALAARVGWAVETLQGALLVADDIMDSATLRRDQPCWHRAGSPPLGLAAINDALLLEGLCFSAVRAMDAEAGLCGRLISLFVETTFRTELGQAIDTLATHPARASTPLVHATRQTQEAIHTYKTAYYTYWLPLAAGVLVASVAPGGEGAGELALDGSALADCAMILGRFFQTQDDYLDLFSPETLGKSGNDVGETKVSWVLVEVLEAAQHGLDMQPFIEELGKADYDADACRAAAEKAGLPAAYAEFSKRTEADLRTAAESLPEGIKKCIIFSLEKILNRQR